MAQENRIDFLDGMRGLAILAVVFYHYLAQIYGVPRSSFYNLHTPLYFGYLGVPLFFAVSGYVIFMTLDNTRNFGGFMVRRWIRLFPAMLVATLLIPVVAYFLPYRYGGIPKLIDLVPGLSLLGANAISALTGIHTDGLERGFWTVYVEVRFYVMFGIFYYLLGKRKAFFSMTALSIALLGLMQLSTLMGGAYAERGQNIFGKILIGHHLPWFLLGMYIYLFNFKQQHVVLLLIVGNILAFNRSSVGSLLATSILIFIIYGAFNIPTIQSMFRSRLLLFFGFVSYPLYLFNDSIGRGIVLGLHKYAGESVPFEVFSLVALAIILPPVWCIAKYIEPTMQRWLKRRLLQRNPPQIAPLPLKQG